MFDDTLISIHAPTRGATILCNHRGLVFGFQSTLPREERLSFPCNISFHLIFQSTLPREERQTMRKLTIAELNFNPRSHERSDPMVKKFLLMKMISIHAPTRGATRRGGQLRYIVYISIHAPTRGATGKNENMSAIIVDFNPRSHERSDCTVGLLGVALCVYFNPRSHERSDWKTCRKLRTSWISIHAPTRGATYFSECHTFIIEFQSTLPREERHACSLQKSNLNYFNPRSHERSDKDSIATYFKLRISIHAPTRGATKIRVV